MDSDNFLGFDTATTQHEDELERLEDEDYDALNDETFGSAAMDGDWEEGHEQMANLTEARRITRKQQDYHNSLKQQQQQQQQQQQDDGGLLGNFQNLSLLNYSGQDGHHLGQSSAPVNIVGYQSRHHGHPHMGSSLLGGHDLPGSPNSIWTPSPDLDKLPLVMRQSPSNGMNRSLGQPPGLAQLGALPSMDLQTVKTVAEIEEEMKLQQNRPHPSVGHMNAMRAEDLEREISRQAASRPPQHHQGMVGPMHPSQQYNLQRQGSFTGGLPNNHQFNRQFQRPFPNQGNYQGSMPPYPPQQQNFVNNFPNNNNMKGMMPPHNQPPPAPPPHHNHHQQYGQGHDNYGMYQHHNNYHNHGHHPQQQQQQQQNHHYQNRISENRYMNSNGYDQVRNGNQYDRRNFDRRPYDQNRGHDQGKGHYDRSSNNCRDDYQSHSGRTRRDSEAEWEEWHRLREEDEFCGLMTPKEKGWLKNIQAMQLNSENPYLDDYYYVMYSVKQQRKREEEVISIDGLQLLLPDRGKDGGREYEPPRLENSLGKLQVVSVNAPRKIIDLQVVHLDPSHPTTPLQREMRKHRHLLLHIEKLFNVMMELDDLERKIRHLPDCPTRDLYKSKSHQLASKLWENLTATPEKLTQLLCIRKGKSLLHRLMMWLGESAYMKLVMTILQNMPLLTKRDVYDQNLALFWPITDRLIACSSQDPLLEFAKALLVQGGASQKANLISALYNKYGVSLILALMVRGEHLSAEIEGCAVWQDLLAAIINALASLPDSTNKSSSSTDTIKSSSSTELPQALPSVALAASPFRPSSHLSKCSVGLDRQLVKSSQERMMLLEVTHSKSSTQSPAKS